MLLPLLLAIGLAADKRYVIVSSSRDQQVLYWQAPPLEQTDLDLQKATQSTSVITDPAIEPQILIRDLQAPVGIAVDQPRHGLYVADPEALKIYRYVITPTATGLMVGDPTEVVTNLAVRWVAVDALGSLFFSDEGNSAIYKIDATKLVDTSAHGFLQSELGSYTLYGSYLNKLVDPEKLYDGQQVTAVSSPGGLAVDNFRVFWTNKGSGTEVGSVVQGLETPHPSDPTATTMIARNAIKVYGVCLSSSNVFFTDGDKKFLYGTKKMGGGIATISEGLKGPRGCAWDGDGTVYVADEAGDTVYSFPANMRSLSPQKLKASFSIAGPNGVGVFTVSFAPALALAAWLLA